MSDIYCILDPYASLFVLNTLSTVFLPTSLVIIYILKSTVFCQLPESCSTCVIGGRLLGWTGRFSSATPVYLHSKTTGMTTREISNRLLYFVAVHISTVEK